jgi:hypothetical protein
MNPSRWRPGPQLVLNFRVGSRGGCHTAAARRRQIQVVVMESDGRPAGPSPALAGSRDPGGFQVPEKRTKMERELRGPLPSLC